MQDRSVLRFIHASNLRLGQVVSGVGRVSDDLRQTLIDAPWGAAVQVFDQAVALGVDFVLLNGDVVPDGVESGRATAFLHQQFARLNQYGITVYWRTETESTSAWGNAFSWPENVHLVLSNGAEAFVVRNGQAIASVASGLTPRSSNCFSIALSDGTRRHQSGDYVADCGMSRDDSTAAGRTVHSPGVTQGLGFHESGATGCSLIELDHNNTLSISQLETSVLRWEACRLAVPAGTSTAVEDLIRQQIIDRVHAVGPLQLFRFVLDVEDTATALGLEAVDLGELGQRVQPDFDMVSLQRNYYVLSIEPGAGMLVACDAPKDAACVGDFRRLVHRRGEDCVQALRRRGVYHSETPQLQLLNGVARLGKSLLS